MRAPRSRARGAGDPSLRPHRLSTELGGALGIAIIGTAVYRGQVGDGVPFGEAFTSGLRAAALAGAVVMAVVAVVAARQAVRGTVFSAARPSGPARCAYAGDSSRRPRSARPPWRS
jgi:hypothetical protein